MDECKKTIVTFVKGMDDGKCKKEIERAVF
jgi:hypothetical protein